MQPAKPGVHTAFFQVMTSGSSGIEAREVSRFKQNEEFRLTLGQVKNMSSEFNGEIGVVLCDRTGKVVEILHSNENARIPWEGNYYNAFPLTITEPIKPGYRIRIYYKHAGTEEWKWARRDKLRTTDEIVVCASPEDIAKMTSLHYIPDTKKLSLRTLLALEYEIKNEAEEVVVSGVKKGAGGRVYKGGNEFQDAEVTLDLNTLEKGNYTVSLTCGDQPYVFVLTI